MSKRSTNESDSSDDSEAKRQKMIQSLNFRSTIPENNLVIDQINGMLALISEHAYVLTSGAPITRLSTYHAYDKTELRVESDLFSLNDVDDYYLVVFGNKKAFKLYEIAELLAAVKLEKEAIFITALKAAVETKMEFYGRLVQAHHDLRLGWKSLADYKNIQMTTVSLSLHKNVIYTLDTSHRNLKTPEAQELWLEWTKSAIPGLAYALKAEKAWKENT
jgi:hypothetical protein